MKKINYIVIILMLFLLGISNAKAADYEYYCTKEAATQLAKIIYKEVGTDSAINSEDNFFMKLSTAAVSINNANSKSGNSFYEKIYNLTDSNYDGYSKYKDQSFESVVPSSKRNEMLYIAELVLTGKYTFPSNMTLQASKEIVENYGTVWSSVENKDGYKDIYFGYEQGNLSSTNIYNETLEDNSVTHYKKIASDLENIGYSSYTVNNVCSAYSSPIANNTTTGNTETNYDPGVCANPEILRVVYFFTILIDIVKIVVPLGLIIFGLIDFSKAAISSDEGAQKKSGQLFLKRLLYGVLIFAIPWIIEVLMVTIGNLTEDNATTNFTDCLENANSSCIEALDSGNITTVRETCDVPNDFKFPDDEDEIKPTHTGSCWQCNSPSSIYDWDVSGNDTACKSGWHASGKSPENCPVNKCWYCTGVPDYAWSSGMPSKTCNGGIWQATLKSQGSCNVNSNSSSGSSGHSNSPNLNGGMDDKFHTTTRD